MNLQNIISELEKADPEVYERLDTRRSAMKNFANMTGKIALASLPFALGSMFKKAYAGDKDTVIDVLNFALTLEYLENDFYMQGLATPNLIPTDSSNAKGAFMLISQHEAAHVKFLQTAITSAGGTPVSKPTFDFTAKGTFPTVFANYDVFLAVSQTLEDTGVRAYKGQATALMSNRTVLTAALRIHSVEARHASKLRKLRKDRNGATVTGNVKPWITLNQSGIDAGSSGANGAIQKSYNGEELTTQAGVNIIGIGGYTYIDASAASESFDEPLTKAQVLDIASAFIV